jgi:GntP family gluconate:H+ symporter
MPAFARSVRARLDLGATGCAPRVTTLAAGPITHAGTGQLVLAAVLGIAVVVVLIAWAKWRPFLVLIMGSAVLGLVAGSAPDATVTSFTTGLGTTGLGTTVGSVGSLIALGSMIGALLVESVGADGIVGWIVTVSGPRDAARRGGAAGAACR